MGKRRIVLSCGMFALIVGTLLVPDVHWALLGWIKGESFYRGRPTSWWSKSLAHELRPEEKSQFQHLVNCARQYAGLEEQPAPATVDDLLEDPAAIPVLAALLQDADEQGMKLADKLLKKGAGATPAFPALGQFHGKHLNHPDIWVRADSAYCVAFFDPGNKKCVPALLEVLRLLLDGKLETANNHRTCYQIITALYSVGENATLAIPALRELASDETEVPTDFWTTDSFIRVIWAYSQRVDPATLDPNKLPLGPTVGEAASQALARIEGTMPVAARRP